ncbi:MAG: mechanosensitive ion channel [Gaiellales bacterium]
MSDQTTRAIITGGVWLVAVLVLRLALNSALRHFERRPGGPEAARRRTTFSLLAKVVIAIAVAVGVWNVLSIFPSTTSLAKAMLASSAVLALFAGLAFSTPLANLGSGLLVAFSQPLRLGDRVTIGEHTGFVEQMTLIYTTLVTDDARRIFVPNTQLTAAPIVNRTIHDPRRAASARFPVGIDIPVARAREALLAAVAPLEAAAVGDSRVLVDEITADTVWLGVTVYAPLDADVSELGSRIREAGLEALREQGFLHT